MLDALRKSGGGAIPVSDAEMISCTKEVGAAEGVFPHRKEPRVMRP